MSDLAADLEEAMRRLYAAPMRAHTPLMSLRCGLHDQHAPDCRSAICECRCHLPAIPE